MKSQIRIRDYNENNLNEILENCNEEYPKIEVIKDDNGVEIYYDIDILQIPSIGTDLFTYFGLAVVEEVTFSLIENYPTFIWIRLI